ncbi:MULTISPECIES: hypothetical protein [Sphingomonas]|uniref:hypothetical protein n=1 Tax=Sphingomonas TaxID=13687 RepID=UPI000B25934B|nr:hypothetical protein [Sphingomonas sp. CCH10-B3]
MIALQLFPIGRWQTGRSPRVGTPGPGIVFPLRARQPDSLPPFSAPAFSIGPDRPASVGRTARADRLLSWPHSSLDEGPARAGFMSARQTRDALAECCRNVLRRSRGALSRLSRAGMARKAFNPGEIMLDLSG